LTEAAWQHYWDRRESLTEQDWLACPASRPMLAFIQGKASDRKIKLFEVACCRRIWKHLDDATRQTVEAWERFAEGMLTRDELRAALDKGWFDPGDHAWSAAISGEESAQSELLRDIIGNPFRPVALDPAWLTRHDGLVVSMAQKMYDSRDFSDMPVLADALEEAGCANQDSLNHCRSGGEHIRGCWVVDALLGKS
jgi:hypothetical protein